MCPEYYEPAPNFDHVDTNMCYSEHTSLWMDYELPGNSQNLAEKGKKPCFLVVQAHPIKTYIPIILCLVQSLDLVKSAIPICVVQLCGLELQEKSCNFILQNASSCSVRKWDSYIIEGYNCMK